MVSIITFDELKILVNGENILNKIGAASKKTLILQYLLANLNEEVKIKDIAGVLWENDDTQQAIDAAKVAINSLRDDLAVYDIANCLLIRKDTCAWALAKDIDIDFVTMQNTYRKAKEAGVYGEDVHEEYEKILFIYAGEVFSTLGDVAWLKEKRAFFAKMYTEAVKEYAQVLHEEKKHNDVVRVAKIAIEKLPLDVNINILFMQALLNLNRPAEALAQYENVTNLYYIYFGGALPKELIEFYKILVVQEKQANENIRQIFDDLANEDDVEGALLCEYSIFKYIYRLYMRNLKRLETSVYVVLVRLQSLGGAAGPIETDRAMGRLSKVLRQNLRTGDAMSRQSIMTYALLLPRVNSESTCRFVMERIKQRFYADTVNTNFTIDYKMLQLQENEE